MQFSLSGKIESANPVAARLLGFSTLEELIETAGPFLAQVRFEQPANYSYLLTQLQKTGQIIETTFEFVRALDDIPGCLQGTFRRIEAVDDQPAFILASLIDVRDRRENERLHSELKAVREASTAKTDFLINMSHEIRTPMNGVTGSLELLGGTQLSTAQERYLQVAKTSTTLLFSALTDIQDVAKIQGDALTLEADPFSLHELVNDILQTLAPRAINKDLIVSSIIELPETCRLIGDPARVRQVIFNFVDNAIKFTEVGAVSLKVLCHSLQNGSAQLEFCIEDTGQGIPEEQKQNLLELFSMANTATMAKHGGARLGLTLCHQLILLMKGSISLNSIAGRGTIFSIRIAFPLEHPAAETLRSRPSPTAGPRLDASSTPTLMVYTRAAPPTAAPGTEYCVISAETLLQDQLLSREKTDELEEEVPADENSPLVLIVEDNPINQIVAEETLLDAGYRVTLAENGEEALTLIEKGDIDLVLMDCQMPVLDGFAATRRIRTNERDAGILVSQQLPIIALTANTVKGDREKCLAAGMNDYVTKPFQPDTLFSVLDQYVYRPALKSNDSDNQQDVVNFG